MNVFYAWQADTPPRIGKQFIRQALDAAVEQLAETLELDEADRPTVDQDTQGVLGDPPIADTIFEKIRDSQVVVADVTLTCATPEGKKLINSNVAYELGYAHGYHGHGVILKVMNTHYGTPDELPFDLKHRRWPRVFELSENASRKHLREVRAALAKEFAGILQQYLEGKNPGKKYDPIPATINAASYWKKGELLVKSRVARHVDENIELGFDKDQPLCYLRIWPDTPLDELSGAVLGDRKFSGFPALMGRLSGPYYDRNRLGAIAYHRRDDGGPLSVTQLFKNREIWGVDADILRSREGYDINFVPIKVYEEGIRESLSAYLEFAFDQLGYPDVVHIEAGMVNINGYTLAMPRDYVFDRFWGPMFEDFSVRTTVDRNEPQYIVAPLMKIFEEVFAAAGKNRPANLHGFPPTDST